MLWQDRGSGTWIRTMFWTVACPLKIAFQEYCKISGRRSRKVLTWSLISTLCLSGTSPLGRSCPHYCSMLFTLGHSVIWVLKHSSMDFTEVDFDLEVWCEKQSGHIRAVSMSKKMMPYRTPENMFLHKCARMSRLSIESYVSAWFSIVCSCPGIGLIYLQ